MPKGLRWSRDQLPFQNVAENTALLEKVYELMKPTCCLSYVVMSSTNCIKDASDEDGDCFRYTSTTRNG